MGAVRGLDTTGDGIEDTVIKTFTWFKDAIYWVGEYVETGSLSVIKNVINADATEEFTFTLSIYATDIYCDLSKITAAKSDGTAIELTVDEENASIAATFTLKGGESLTISNIPAGVTYTVSESDAENYEKTVEGNESGTIAVGANVVTYTNTYVEPETPTEPETPEKTEPETPDEETTETTEEVEEEPTETVVEAVTDPVTTTSAETGDIAPLVPLMMLLLLCGAALLVLKKENINF